MSLKRNVFIFGSSLTTIVGLLFRTVKLFHARPLHFLAKKDRITASLGFSAYQKSQIKGVVL